MLIVCFLFALFSQFLSLPPLYISEGSGREAEITHRKRSYTGNWVFSQPLAGPAEWALGWVSRTLPQSLLPKDLLHFLPSPRWGIGKKTPPWFRDRQAETQKPLLPQVPPNTHAVEAGHGDLLNAQREHSHRPTAAQLSLRALNLSPKAQLYGSRGENEDCEQVTGPGTPSVLGHLSGGLNLLSHSISPVYLEALYEIFSSYFSYFNMHS